MKWDSRVLGSFWNVSAGTELSRLYHTSVIVGQDMYVYGGLINKNNEEPTNSFIQYHLESGEYNKIDSENIPALSQHTFTLLKDGKLCVYLFGGCDSKNQPRNEMFCFDFEKREWKKINCKGTIPSPRYGHSATVIDGSKIYIFGGTNGHEYFKDLYIYCTETNTWTRVKTQKQGPSERSGHTAVAYGTKIYVFGGGNDKDTLSWEKITPVGSLVPFQRIHHTANVIGNKMIIFGGVGRVYSNEVMVFDLETLSWHKEFFEKSCHTPPCLYGHTSAQSNNKLWVFGGKCIDKYSAGILYTLETGIKGVEPITIGRSTMSKEFLSLVNNRLFSDVILELNEKTHFYCHKAILLVRCPLLHRECVRQEFNDTVSIPEVISILSKKKLREKKLLKTNTSIMIQNISPESFLAMLEFIYTDQVLNLEKLNETQASHLLYLSSLFNLERLYAICQATFKYEGDLELTESIPAPSLHLDLKKLFEIAQIEKKVDVIQEEENEEEEVECSSVASSMSSGLETTVSLNTSQSSYTDVVFTVEKEKIKAHKCILVCRSTFFHQFLENTNQEISAKKDIEITGIRARVFKIILQFLYTDDAEINFDVALELLIASKVYELERLSLMCQAAIERKIHVHNVCRIFLIADTYDFEHLRKACVCFIAHHFSQVRRTSTYRELDKQLKFELKMKKKEIYQQTDQLLLSKKKKKKKFVEDASYTTKGNNKIIKKVKKRAKGKGHRPYF